MDNFKKLENITIQWIALSGFRTTGPRIAHPTGKMKPQNHEFGVPRWQPQDFRLIETMATSVANAVWKIVDQPRKAHWTWSTKMAPVASKFYWQNILYA